MKRIAVGQISGAFGVRGWVKVRSYTEPKENVLSYSPWQLEQRGQILTVEVLAGRPHGRTVVASLEGITTREQAQALSGAKISIERSQLPELPPGQFYWADLIGCEVLALDGRSFGQVVDLLETGANDVLIVQSGAREILIPWLRERVIRQVDIEAGTIRVDWDPDY